MKVSIRDALPVSPKLEIPEPARHPTKTSSRRKNAKSTSVVRHTQGAENEDIAGTTQSNSAFNTRNRQVANAGGQRKRTLVKKQAMRAVQNARLVVYFMTNTWKLSQKSIDRVQEFARRYEKTDPIFSVIGHADQRGDPSYNRQLGLERAKYVVDLLLKAGVKRRRLTNPQSLGSEKPKITNLSDAASWQNRRVVIIAFDRANVGAP